MTAMTLSRPRHLLHSSTSILKTLKVCFTTARSCHGCEVPAILPGMKFRYTPLTPLNNLFFAIIIGSFLLLMAKWGDAAWQWTMAHMSLPVFFVGAGFAFYMSVFWLFGGAYFLLSARRAPNFLYRHKIQQERESKRRRISHGKAIARVLFNQFFGTLPVLFLVFTLLRLRGYGVDQPLPSWWAVVLQIAAMVLIEDVLFFTSHYALHQKFLFKKVHYIHHQYRESISIATHYVHFIEHLFGNLLPVFAGVVLLMPHPWVVMLWVMIVVINALHTHSGFAFPWMSYAVHHDWHHYYVNSSYSAIGLMDKIFGTDRPFDELKAKSGGSTLRHD